MLRAFALSKDVKALESRDRPLADLSDIGDLMSEETRRNLISAEAFKKLQIDMNKVLQAAPRDYLEGTVCCKGMTWMQSTEKPKTILQHPMEVHTCCGSSRQSLST